MELNKLLELYAAMYPNRKTMSGYDDRIFEHVRGELYSSLEKQTAEKQKKLAEETDALVVEQKKVYTGPGIMGRAI